MTRVSGFAVNPGWRVILVDLGIHPADVLRRAELPEDLLGRENARISTAEFFRFWEAIEAESKDPLLPIRLGEVIRAEAFDPALFAAICSPNFLVAAQRIAKYKPLICDLRLGVIEDDKRVTLTFEWPPCGIEPPRSLVMGELVFFTALARLATRAEIKPLRVITSRPPDMGDAYADYFGSHVQAGPRHSVTFARADALRPFLTHNEAMWNAFEPNLKKRLSDLDDSATTADRVHAALLEGFPSGATSIDDVAKKLAMSRRTLQRRLSAESTAFQAVLDATREELARHYLGRTTMTSAEISFLLGFEEPNSFSRAFHRWTGSTPETIRRALSVAAVT